MKLKFCVIPMLLALSACQTDPQLADNSQPEEKVYVTGSNLPQRDKSAIKTMSKEAAEELRRNATVMNTGAAGLNK